MGLTIGTQLGSHEITGLLGKGGMGEVYRARDLKLKREVAIKILPEEFALDADRISRFQREAEVLASLTIQILPRFTMSQTRTRRDIWCSSWWRAKPWRTASREDRFWSRKRSTLHGKFVKRLKLHMKKASSIGI